LAARTICARFNASKILLIVRLQPRLGSGQEEHTPNQTGRGRGIPVRDSNG
jgi:hypothetical protein